MSTASQVKEDVGDVERGKASLTFKIFLVLACACFISSTGLLMRASEHDGTISFSPLAATAMAELIKLLMAVCMGKFQFDGVRSLTRVELGLFLIPALGYFLANNLRFLLIEAVNPGLLQLLWNLKIVVIGFLYSFPPMRRRLSRQQWFGATLLVLGTSTAEASQWGSRSSDGQRWDPPITPSLHSGFAGSGTKASLTLDSILPLNLGIRSSNTGGLPGLSLLAVNLIIASASAVACEFAYKSTASHALHEQVEFLSPCGLQSPLSL